MSGPSDSPLPAAPACSPVLPLADGTITSLRGELSSLSSQEMHFYPGAEQPGGIVPIACDTHERHASGPCHSNLPIA
eukprot:6234788-Amphidinium_carterae.1